MGSLNVKFRMLGVFTTLAMLLVPFQNCSRISFRDVASTGPVATGTIPDQPSEEPPAEEPPPVAEEPPPVVVEPPPVVVEPPPVVVEPPPVVVQPPPVVVQPPPPPPPPPPLYKMEFAEKSQGYACSPLGSVLVPSDKSGLKTELRYLNQQSTLTDTMKTAIQATSYFDDSQASLFVKVPETLYLSDVNVPTRAFENGFAMNDQSLIRDSAGNALIEYFGLKMDTVLKLGANDPEGYYELATVSDDGTVVDIKENNQWVRIINNDGNHAPKMGCMSRRVYMTKTTRLPMRMYYNQGPRYLIANVLMWNYRGTSAAGVSAGLPTDDQIHVHCGKESHLYFWSNQSVPQVYVNELVAVKWKTLSTENFQLPDNEVNPCFYSQYDLNPVLAGVGTTRVATLTLSEPAALQVNIYKLGAGGSKLLVNGYSAAANSSHVLDFSDLDIASTYSLEVFMTISNKQIKVMKEFTLSFVQVQ